MNRTVMIRLATPEDAVEILKSIKNFFKPNKYGRKPNIVHVLISR